MLAVTLDSHDSTPAASQTTAAEWEIGAYRHITRHVVSLLDGVGPPQPPAQQQRFPETNASATLVSTDTADFSGRGMVEGHT
jgi:hypothetical protein